MVEDMLNTARTDTDDLLCYARSGCIIGFRFVTHTLLPQHSTYQRRTNGDQSKQDGVQPWRGYGLSGSLMQADSRLTTGTAPIIPSNVRRLFPQLPQLLSNSYPSAAPYEIGGSEPLQ